MIRIISAALLMQVAMAFARPATGPATRPTEADRLGAASLRNGARHMSISPDAPARAGRLVALTLFADRLVPGESETNWLLVNIHESQGNLSLAAKSAADLLKAYPSDYSLGRLWMQLELASHQTAEDRLAFLGSVMEDTARAAPLRADAAVLSASILLGQGRENEAIKRFDEALKLDPYNTGALTGRMELAKARARKPSDRAATMLKLLHSSPRDFRMLWRLATLMNERGLYPQSLSLFDYAEKILRGPDGKGVVPAGFAVHYFSAMLDAGRSSDAAVKFEPLLEEYPDSADLKSLLVEAYRDIGKIEKADKLVKKMETGYEIKRPAAQTSVAFSTELAWFYLVTSRKVNLALKYAQNAAKLDASDPLVRRILGATQLAVRRDELVKDAVASLKALLGKDIYAAVFLAEHFFRIGDAKEGSKALLAGLKPGRSGPAFRRLRTLAARQGIEIPPADGAEEILSAFNAFDKRYLEMGVSPEKFISASIEPVGASVVPGEPIAVKVTLRNIGEVDVPLGGEGLLNPTMSLQVAVQGTSFADLPLASWPAPRDLKPGESVSTTVRLDGGGLAKFLASRPLDEIVLTITGLLDPVQERERFRSSLPNVKVKPAKIRRMGLLESFSVAVKDDWPAAYRTALAYIVRDFQKGRTPVRMRAARQVGSLLALVREMETSRRKLPAPRDSAVRKPVLLSMLQAVLQDRSPLVRAEMVASLGFADIDAQIMSLLAPVIEDRSALVRMRVVELIGASNLQGRKTVVDYLAQDADELVRRMAAAFSTGSK